MKIDDKKFKVKPINYIKSITKKEQIIIGDSLRSLNNQIIHLKNKEMGNTKTWPTFTISRDGLVYQHFDPKYYSNYMGNNLIDRKAISISLENMGYLKYDNTLKKYINWCNEICDDQYVISKEWKDYSYWEKYSLKQMESLVELTDKLIKDFSINRDCIGFNFYTESTGQYDGIVCRSNYSYDFNDVNPTFDYKYFLDSLEIQY